MVGEQSLVEFARRNHMLQAGVPVTPSAFMLQKRSTTEEDDDTVDTPEDRADAENASNQQKPDDIAQVNDEEDQNEGDEANANMEDLSNTENATAQSNVEDTAQVNKQHAQNVDDTAKEDKQPENASDDSSYHPDEDSERESGEEEESQVSVEEDANDETALATKGRKSNANDTAQADKERGTNDANTAQGILEEETSCADTAQRSNRNAEDADEPANVYDTLSFIDALREENMFEDEDDDTNICVNPQEESESDQESVEAYSEVDMDVYSDAVSDDEEVQFDLSKDTLRTMASTGWTVYEQEDSSQLTLDGATDLYDGEYGPTTSAVAFAEYPLGMFFYFLPKAMWIRIAEETNRYRAQIFERLVEERMRSQERRQSSNPNYEAESDDKIRQKLSKWKPVQAHEIVHYIGLLVARTLCPKRTALAEHWATSEDGAVPRGTFGKFMSRQRFEDITRYLHFNDNSSDRRRYDKAWKVRPLLQVTQKTFNRGYRLGKYLSFDEGMVGSRHQYNPMRVYMSDKPTKWGTKFFMLCCAKTGYCSRYELFHSIQHKLWSTNSCAVPLYTSTN